ncbi:MAG: T9SS type A sorting domain-containing protein [Bacteroidota bacterium]
MRTSTLLVGALVIGLLAPNSIAQPANRDIIRSAGIAGDGVFSGTNMGNGRFESPLNPSASCTAGGEANDGDNAAWWWFVPTSNGTVTIDLAGSNFDTILTINQSPPVTPVACNDDDSTNGPGDFTSRIENFPITAGQRYYIRVTGYQGDAGSIVGSINSGGAITGPPNDRLTNAQPIEDDTYLGSNVGAGIESGESSSVCGSQGSDGNNSVWYTFTPQRDATLRISTEGSTFNTLLSLRNASGNEIRCNLNGPGTETSLLSSVSVEAFARYFIRVTGSFGASGAVQLNVSGLSPVANEDVVQPEAALLVDAYPNPFVEATTIAYTLDTASPVHIDAYDVLGRHVATLVDGVQPAGPNAVTLDGAGLPPGLYVVRIQTPTATQAVRVSRLR